MGLVTQGIPQQITMDLARLGGATVFVETGTFRGDTARWAAGHFQFVHTIERAEGLYNRHRDELARVSGVTPHLGDSRAVLPQLLREIHAQKALYWLDGHWSGGETAGQSDECPLLDELACLSERAEDIILIDDARLFLCAPPLPHDAAQWPTLPDIIDALPAAMHKPFVQIIDDVIFIVPRADSLRDRLISYARSR